MNVLYISATGLVDATRASIPIHLAVNGSLEAGQQASLLLLGDASELIVGDAANAATGIGLPAMADLLTKARDRELPIVV